MKNKKFIYILSLIILVILSIVLFTSYGFINAKIGGNETSKKAVFNSQILKVEYSDGTETLTSGDNGYFKPGSTLTKTFTITNTGNMPVKYSINLTEITNDFERFEDLTYEIKRGEEVLNSGVFPQSDTYIVSKDTLELNESKTYTLIINYLNSEENQIVDTGKVIKSKITIDDTIKTISSLLVYGNSIQDGTPSPETPVEIESLGEKTKNLFNLEGREVKDFGVYSPSIRNLTGDGIYLGVAASNYYYGGMKKYNIDIEKNEISFISYRAWYGIGFDFKVKPNTTYTASIKGKAYIGIMQFTKDGEFIKGVNKGDLQTFTTESNTEWIVMVISGSLVTDTIQFNEIQLTESSEQLRYQPYGKYEIPISISSKNLFDISKLNETSEIKKNDAGSLTISAYPSGTWQSLQELCPEMKVGQTITFSMKTTGYPDIYLYNTTTKNNWYWGSGGKKVVTQELLDSKVYFYKQTSAQGGGNAIISNIQFEEGTKATGYENYMPGGQTYYIYLDEPLRKVGDCDTCADYLDYENQQVVRYINRVIPNNGFIYRKTNKVLRMTALGITGAKIASDVLSPILPYKGVLWGSEEEVIFKHNSLENYAYMSFTWDRLGLVYDGTNIYKKDDATQTALSDRDVYWHFQGYIDKLDKENRYMYYSLAEPIKTDIEIPVMEGIKRITNNISICNSSGVCASNIEVEYDD